MIQRWLEKFLALWKLFKVCDWVYRRNLWFNCVASIHLKARVFIRVTVPVDKLGSETSWKKNRKSKKEGGEEKVDSFCQRQNFGFVWCGQLFGFLNVMYFFLWWVDFSRMSRKPWSRSWRRCGAQSKGSISQGSCESGARDRLPLAISSDWIGGALWISGGKFAAWSLFQEDSLAQGARSGFCYKIYFFLQ